MAKKESTADKLKKKLFMEKESAWNGIDEKKSATIMKFSEGYKEFLNVAKTEREVLASIKKIAEKKKFAPIEKAKKSDKKLFLSYDGVSGALAVINDPEAFAKGFLMVGSHIDVPRIDLKGNPLYEAEDMAFMKTHYYGGIKKYQWVTRPLALHGVVVKKSGEVVNVAIGEKDSDPVFTINDLLPHLAQQQMQKKAGEVIEGENLNILVGSIPYEFKSEKDGIKLAVMKYLNDEYGIVEEDFVSAELQLVPAGKARDVGFDRSFVGVHGHDDRVCTFTGMQAIFDAKNQKKNMLMVFFDKEEIGSKGNAGADSNILERIVNDVINHYGKGDYNTLIKALENSSFLSADVNAAVDPEWASVNEPKNAGHIGKGVCLTKFTGVRGKGSSNEAHAEFVAKCRAAFDKGGAAWQTAELGKVDQGGGGTIAMFIAEYGMDVIDCGTAILSMHSPFEVASKADIYHTYLAYKSFYDYLK